METRLYNKFEGFQSSVGTNMSREQYQTLLK